MADGDPPPCRTAVAVCTIIWDLSGYNGAVGFPTAIGNDWATVEGAFVTPGIPNVLITDVIINDGRLDLVLIPEPGTAGLFGLGLVALIVASRRNGRRA